MAMWQFVLVTVFVLSPTSAVVSLERDPVSSSVCPGDLLTFTCAVNSGSLRWLNSAGKVLGSSFLGSNPPGTNQTVGDFTFNLTSVVVDNLTSTATIRSPDNLQGITLQCSDVAGSTETSTFNVEPVFTESYRTTWSNSFCTNQPNGIIQLSWSAPANRNCCVSYQVDLSDGRVFVSNTTSIALPGSLFGLGVFDVRVRCLSATGFKAISSESRSILNSQLTLLVNRESRCEDDVVVYRVSWSPCQITTVQVCTVQLLEPIIVTCYFGATARMMSETVGQGYAICRYSREDAAQGNVSIAVTGTTNFGRLENLRNSSGDNGNDCQRINALTGHVSYLTGTAGAVGGTLGSLLFIVAVIFIIAFICICCPCCLCLKKPSKQHHDHETGMSMRAVNEKAEL